MKRWRVLGRQRKCLWTMSCFVIFLVSLKTASPQERVTRLPTDEAMKHIGSNPSPVYPELARQTHISGDVLLEIVISLEGTTSVRRVISGHPLLVQAAIDAVLRWRFQQFVSEGRPIAAITVVIVPIGEASHQAAEDQVEVRFQYEFWSQEGLFRVALAKGDHQSAGEHLEKAEKALTSTSDKRNNRETMQWWLDKGDLNRVQQKYDQAEESYKKALETAQEQGKEIPQCGMVLGVLGALYEEEKHFESAEDDLKRSIVIYEKVLKNTNPGSGALQIYSTAIANESWLLAKVELKLNNKPEATKQCRRVLKLERFLSDSNRDSAVSQCNKTVAEAH